MYLANFLSQNSPIDFTDEPKKKAGFVAGIAYLSVRNGSTATPDEGVKKRRLTDVILICFDIRVLNVEE
jgi:hypothetical protein